MKKPFLVFGIAFIGFLFILLAWSDPEIFFAALRQPFGFLTSSSKEMNVNIIDVPDLPQTLRVAGRRLLTPFAPIRRARRLALPSTDR